MFCTSCGSPASADLAFCTSCGAQLRRSGDAAAGASTGGAPEQDRAPAPWEASGAGGSAEELTSVTRPLPRPDDAPWLEPAPSGASPSGRGARTGPLVAGAAALAAVLGGAAWFAVPALLDRDPDDGERASVARAVEASARASAAPSPSDEPGEGEQPSASPAAQLPAPPPPATAAPPAVPVRLSPVSVEATCQADAAVDSRGLTVTYEPERTLDRDPSTAWRCPGPAVGIRLVYRFAQPVTVTSVGLVPGYDKIDPADGIDRFTENRTVSAVVWSLDDGSTHRQDVPQPTRALVRQALPGDAARTSSVTLEIAATGNDSARRDFTPISEVEFAGY